MITEKHKVILSTQERAREIFSSGPESAVITAGEQLAGYGRRGSRWVSPPGGIYFSVILPYPDSLRRYAGIYAVYSALKAVERQGAEACFKWPNDIMSGEKKAGGILIEFPSSGWSITGVGINSAADRDLFGLIKDSVETFKLDRARFIEDFIENFSKCPDGKINDKALKYVSERDYLKGRAVRAGGTEGVAKGIGGSGELILETPSGTVKAESGRATVLKALPRPVLGPVILADIGNTFTSAGSVLESGLIKSISIPTRPHGTLAERIKKTLKSIGAVSASGSAVSCVVPETRRGVHAFLSEYGRVITPGPGRTAGLTLKINEPEKLGEDRICNAAGIYHYYGADAVAADLGTANTFDVTSREGEYLGGVIAPGADSMADALSGRAAQLEKISPGLPGRIIGNDTPSALSSGLYCTLTGQIERIFSAVQKEWKRDFISILTGGGVNLLDMEFREKYITDTDLTFKGLIALWNSEVLKDI